MVVLQKSEGEKVRPVVKTGNRINRKMDFLSEVVERGLYGSRVSTLFAGAHGNEEIDLMWAREVKNPDSLKVPLDQGGFDQHQSVATIKAVLTAIGDVCISTTGLGSDYRKVWEALWFSLMGRRVEVRLGGESFTWGNGIPSGWRWTALLDTMLNYCSLRVIQRIPAIGLTGKRTPAGLWLSDHCSGVSAFKLAGTEEFTQMTGMGDWWVNDYFIQPISQQEDAPQVERGLMRLDLLDVAERDVLFAICPDGRVAPDFSYRVDTSIFQTLAVERGWSGLLPPPATLVGELRPFGWGITTRNRDWSVPNLRIIALSPRIAQWLETTQTLPPIVYKTPVHAPVYKGSGAQAIYRKFGLEKSVGRRKRGDGKGGDDGVEPRGGTKKPDSKGDKDKDFMDSPDGQPTAGLQQKAASSAKKDAVVAAPVKSSGKAGAPTGNETTATTVRGAGPNTSKPSPGGSGTGPAPKTGTTQEEADRNLDHRRPEDTA
ncbi:hypothetical protein ACJJTC_018112 [Scirpophaga incertulas]